MRTTNSQQPITNNANNEFLLIFVKIRGEVTPEELLSIKTRDSRAGIQKTSVLQSEVGQ